MILSAGILIMRGADLLRDNAYEQSFSALTEELSTKGIIGTYWKALILLRWTLVTATLVFLRDHSEF